jgi:hypothetical protein
MQNPECGIQNPDSRGRFRFAHSAFSILRSAFPEFGATLRCASGLVGNPRRATIQRVA